MIYCKYCNAALHRYCTTGNFKRFTAIFNVTSGTLELYCISFKYCKNDESLIKKHNKVLVQQMVHKAGLIKLTAFFFYIPEMKKIIVIKPKNDWD